MLRSPTAIGENFFLNKMRRNCLESCFFIENVGFCFSFPSFVESIFLSVSFRYILYFFWVVNDLTDFVGFAIYFFFIVMKRHNRFFELVTSVLSQRDIVKPWVGYINYTSYLRKSGSFCSICGFYQHVVSQNSESWWVLLRSWYCCFNHAKVCIRISFCAYKQVVKL